MKSIYLIIPDDSNVQDLVKLDQRCLGGIWSLEGYKREIESPNSNFLVLISNNKPIGFGCYWAVLEEAHITLLVVDIDYQGQGLGQLLLYKLIEDAVRKKLERATLEVSVSNQRALELYEKFGFKIAGRRKNYYPTTGEDALILWRGDLQRKEFTETLQKWDNMIGQRISEHNWQLMSSVNSPINT